MLELSGYIFMLVDHICKFLNMKINNFNPILGPLAFPIFAYMSARAVRNTKNTDKYIIRLLIFAFVSQIPYILMIFGIPSLKNITNFADKVIYILTYFTQSLNIGFTLLFGVITIKMIENNKDNILNKIIFLLIFLITAQLVNVDYKAYGVMLIVMFYYVKKLPMMILYMTILNGLNILIGQLTAGVNKEMSMLINTRVVVGIMALPLIYFLGVKKEINIKEKRIKENQKLSNKNKSNIKKKVLTILKYSIYPVHMSIIVLLNYLNIVL